MDFDDKAVVRAERFAARVFTVAGVWGVLVVAPLYFAFDAIGRAYPPPITHPDFYYGFVGVTLAWQLAFLLIATNPVRYQPFMIAAVAEKALYIVAMIALYVRGELQFGQAVVVIVPDGLLAVGFVAAWYRLRTRE